MAKGTFRNRGGEPVPGDAETALIRLLEACWLGRCLVLDFAQPGWVFSPLPFPALTRKKMWKGFFFFFFSHAEFKNTRTGAEFEATEQLVMSGFCGQIPPVTRSLVPVRVRQLSADSCAAGRPGEAG